MMDVYITFDDGRADNLEAASIMNNHGIVGTFFVTCDFIENPSKYDCFGRDRKPLTKNDLSVIVGAGHEIASHGCCHIMSILDFRKSVDYLKSNGLCDESVGFSVPNSKFTDEELDKFVRSNKGFLEYVRVGRNRKCYSFFSKASYCLYHIFGFQWCFNFFNRHNIIYLKDRFRINSLVVKKDTKLSSITKFISKYSSLNCSLVLMFHSIVKEPNDPWEWSAKEFERLCVFLSTCPSVDCKKMSSF